MTANVFVEATFEWDPQTETMEDARLRLIPRIEALIDAELERIETEAQRGGVADDNVAPVSPMRRALRLWISLSPLARPPVPDPYVPLTRAAFDQFNAEVEAAYTRQLKHAGYADAAVLEKLARH